LGYGHTRVAGTCRQIHDLKTILGEPLTYFYSEEKSIRKLNLKRKIWVRTIIIFFHGLTNYVIGMNINEYLRQNAILTHKYNTYNNFGDGMNLIYERMTSHQITIHLFINN